MNIRDLIEITSEGTSEGAEKGWETRRQGGGGDKSKGENDELRRDISDRGKNAGLSPAHMKLVDDLMRGDHSAVSKHTKNPDSSEFVKRAFDTLTKPGVLEDTQRKFLQQRIAEQRRYDRKK